MTSLLPLYLLLCFTTIVTPGAGVLYTVTGSLKYGVRYAWPCVAGNAVGVLIVSFLTAGGLGAVLAASPVLFTTLQAIGGLYLIYLGIQELRAKPFDLMATGNDPDRAFQPPSHSDSQRVRRDRDSSAGCPSGHPRVSHHQPDKRHSLYRSRSHGVCEDSVRFLLTRQVSLPCGKPRRREGSRASPASHESGLRAS